MEAIDAEGKPYTISGDYFLKAYKAVDAEGKKIMESLKALLPKAKVDNMVNFLNGVKGPNGENFLSSNDINLILNNRNGLYGPIENFEEKIMAVLRNPAEVDSISRWKSRAMGVWQAVRDPLNSTVEANPKLFN